MDRRQGKPYNETVPLQRVLRMAVGSAVRPGTILLVVVLGSFIPLLTALDPFPSTSGTETAAGLARELALLQSAVLAAWAIHQVGVESWWTVRSSAAERWCFELALLTLIIVVPTCLLHWVHAGQPPMGSPPNLAAWSWITLAALHMTSLALLLLRLRLPSAMRSFLLLACAWILPATVTDPALLALTAVSIPDVAGLSTRMAPSGIDFAPILAMLLAAWLLEHRPAPRP